jgi:group I intron endonuclease
MLYAGFIYEWTNKKNGMKYLGSHKGTVDDGYKGGGKNFRRAIKKYGIENFERDIVEYVVEETDLFAREQYYLNERNCANSKEYYNISPIAGGGDTGNNHNNWKKVSDDWLVILPSGEEIIIKNMLNFCRQNMLNASAMSSVARGRKGHYKGYRCKKLSNNRNVEYEHKEYTYLSTEEKKKINSDSVKRAKQKNATPKITYNGITYNSLVEAIADTNLSRHLLIKHGILLRNN